MAEKKQINVIAHRGANRKAPQNTLPAFAQAIEDGCDGFETDVHLSSDGEVVICHNDTINEMSDGAGDISSFTLAELRCFDFGCKFSEEYAGTTLPTLDEFLSLVTKAGKKIINIEIKCPKKESDKLVRRTLDVIGKYDCLENIIISSFSPEILRLTKLYCPECRTALLYPTNNPSVCLPLIAPFALAKKLKVDIMHPMAGLVTPSMVRIAHSMGMQVNVWTVNDKKTVAFLAACGVDGIITDTPDRVTGFLRQSKHHV